MAESFKVVTVELAPNQCKLSDELNITLGIESTNDLELLATVSLVLDIAYVRSYYIPQANIYRLISLSRKRAIPLNCLSLTVDHTST